MKNSSGTATRYVEVFFELGVDADGTASTLAAGCSDVVVVTSALD